MPLLKDVIERSLSASPRFKKWCKDNEEWLDEQFEEEWRDQHHHDPDMNMEWYKEEAKKEFIEDKYFAVKGRWI